MAHKQENRLKRLLTTNLEAKLAKGLPSFKRSVEKEIIKHDMSYQNYRKEREEIRVNALKEIEEVREKTKAILEKKLDEINEICETRKHELQEGNTVLTDEEMKEYKEIQNKQYTISNRLERFIEEDRSKYGVENLIEENPSDTDSELSETLGEGDQKEKTIREIVAEHLALGEIPSNFQYSHKYRYPYDPRLNTSGKWDLWKQPWFMETFPKHLLEVLKETSREILKKSSREVFEEGEEEQDENEEVQSKKGFNLFEAGSEEG